MKQNIEIYLADSTSCTRVALVHGISITVFFNLAEFSHSDRNSGILRKKRKNSAKIGMVGSYVSILKKWTSRSFAICLRRVGILDILESISNIAKKLRIFPSNISCNMSLKFQPIQRWLSWRHLLSWARMTLMLISFVIFKTLLCGLSCFGSTSIYSK